MHKNKCCTKECTEVCDDYDDFITFIPHSKMKEKVNNDTFGPTIIGNVVLVEKGSPTIIGYVLFDRENEDSLIDKRKYKNILKAKYSSNKVTQEDISIIPIGYYWMSKKLKK